MGAILGYICIQLTVVMLGMVLGFFLGAAYIARRHAIKTASLVESIS